MGMAVSFFTGLIGGYNRRKAEERASAFDIKKLETAGRIERATRESVAEITGGFTLEKQEAADIAAGEREEEKIKAKKKEREVIGEQEIEQIKKREELEAESAIDVQKSKNVAAMEREKEGNKSDLEKQFMVEYFDFHEGNTIYGATPFDSTPDFESANWFENFQIEKVGKKKDFIKVKQYDYKNPTGFLDDVLAQYAIDPKKFLDLKDSNYDAFMALVGDWGKALNKSYADNTSRDAAGKVVSMPAYDKIYEPLISALPEFNDTYTQMMGQGRADAANIYNKKNETVDNQATDVLEEDIEIPLEDGDTAMVKALTAYKFDATDFGFPDNEDKSHQQVQKAFKIIAENDPLKRTERQIQNEFYKAIQGQGGTNFHPAMIKAVLLAEPYNDKNVLSPLSSNADALEEYFESNKFFRDNIQAQYEVFKLVTGDNKNFISAQGRDKTLQESIAIDGKTAMEARTRRNAAREADRLANMYLELLAFKEGRGEPTVPILRDVIQKFEGIKDTFTQTLGLLTTMSQREGGEFALSLHNELEKLYGEDGASLWIPDKKNTNLISGDSISAMLNFVEVALAYQTSMAFQGGSGGRTVSNEDYKLVLRAIRGNPASTADQQRARMVQLKGFIEAPLIISNAIVNDGMKGLIASEKFGDFYYASKNIQLGFGGFGDLGYDESLRGESIMSNVQAFEHENNINPTEGVTNSFYLNPNINWKKEKRSRIQAVSVGGKNYAGFLVWEKGKSTPDRFVTVPKNNSFLKAPNMLFSGSNAYPPDMVDGIISQLSDEEPTQEELRELFDIYKYNENFKPLYQAKKEKKTFKQKIIGEGVPLIPGI